MGHTVVDVSLPCTNFALATYYVVAPAEAARRALRCSRPARESSHCENSNLARFNGTSFGEEEDEASLDWENLHASYARLRAQKFGCEAAVRPQPCIAAACLTSRLTVRRSNAAFFWAPTPRPAAQSLTCMERLWQCGGV